MDGELTDKPSRKFSVSRRQLLVGGGIGAGLLLAWNFWPRDHAAPLAGNEGETGFGAWLRIGEDGIVTVAVPQLEMGQGVTTLLPQVAALELGADWRMVAVEPAPTSAAYANFPLATRWVPVWRPTLAALAGDESDMVVRNFAEGERFAATADGTTLAAYETPLREAAASARAMLCMAAAERWDVSWEACRAEGGLVLHEDKALGFGELAVEASGFDPPRVPPLLPVSAADTGEALEPDALPATPRLDAPAKVSGSYPFAGDIRLDGMAHASIRHGPVGDAELTRFDPTKGHSVPGYLGLVKAKRWLAAYATNWWAAEQVLRNIAPGFDTPEPVESAAMAEALDAGLRRGEAHEIVASGEGEAALPDRPTLALRYDLSPAPHATLETAAATARLRDGLCEIWVASQAPEQMRQAVAAQLGLAVEDVIHYPVAAGGSFDRRLDHDHAVEAALIAREAGRPVQLRWSRWQECLAGWPRAPMAAVLAAQTDADGQILAWKTRIAMPATNRELGRRVFDRFTPWAAMEAAEGEEDVLAMEGAVPPYATQNLVVQHVPVRIALPTARQRGNAPAYTAFFTETFIDELARQANREPLGYRIQQLGGEPRLVECLERVTRSSGWGGGLPTSGEGLACLRMGRADRTGRIACVARTRQGEQGLEIGEVHLAVDIGRIPNAEIARQQLEGGVVFALGLATGSALTYAGGLPDLGTLGAMRLPTLARQPEILIELIESDAEPFDPGELSVGVTLPATANALFAATGTRLRTLPLFAGIS
ncbi:MAG: molybdopterin cofactor-binding domain-containing protein [Sphingomonadaceae bacterium]